MPETTSADGQLECVSVMGDSAGTGLALVALAWMIWSVDPVLVTLLGADMPPLFLTGAACLMSGLLLTPKVINGFRGGLRLSRGAWWLLLAHGVFFSALAEMCYVLSLRHLHPAIVSAILRSGIALVVIPAMIFLRERLSRLSMVGVVMVMAANGWILFSAVRQAPETGAGAVWGWALAFLATILWCGGTVAGKHLLHILTPAEMVGMRLLLAALVLAPLSLLLEGPGVAAHLTGRSWGLLAVKGIVTGVLGYLIYSAGLKRTKAYVTGSMEVLAPACTALFASIFLGRTITGWQALHIALLLAGAVVVLLGYCLPLLRARVARAPSASSDSSRTEKGDC